MDVLRDELNEIYARQRLETENLDYHQAGICRDRVGTAVTVTADCRVITDAASDRCVIFGGDFAPLFGFGEKGWLGEFASSDEDVIYERIHPEDLVEKRMLEYEFFNHIDSLSPDQKLHYKATCRLRMRDAASQYRWVDNSTRVLQCSPGGKIWLIMCCYDLSPIQSHTPDITPRIIDTLTGSVAELNLSARRAQLLSPREKEILSLIRQGLPSKQIADRLCISVHTVNRHRQNIICKLSVGNATEAVAAAIAMRLI